MARISGAFALKVVVSDLFLSREIASTEFRRLQLEVTNQKYTFMGLCRPYTGACVDWDLRSLRVPSTFREL